MSRVFCTASLIITIIGCTSCYAQSDKSQIAITTYRKINKFELTIPSKKLIKKYQNKEDAVLYSFPLPSKCIRDNKATNVIDAILLYSAGPVTEIEDEILQKSKREIHYDCFLEEFEKIDLKGNNYWVGLTSGERTLDYIEESRSIAALNNVTVEPYFDFYSKTEYLELEQQVLNFARDKKRILVVCAKRHKNPLELRLSSMGYIVKH